MALVLPVIYFYLLSFYPNVLLAFLPILLVVLGLMFLFRKQEKALVYLLLLVLVLRVGGRAYEETLFASAIGRERIQVISGKVVSNPTRRKNRGVGYRLALDAVLDDQGNAFSAKGTIYVISSFSDVDLGDEVFLDGTMEESYFLAFGTGVLKQNAFGLLRRRLSYLLLRRFPKGENGNLSALLLTGSSLDGTAEISDMARRYGLSYLFALSGMHLAILAMFLRPCFHRLGGKCLGEIAVVLVLLLFVYMNGWKPSLTRALLFLVLSKLLETEYSFCFSFLFLLLLFPFSVSDLGTTLSFVSLGGILFLSERMVLPVKTAFPFFTGMTSAMVASTGALVFSVPILMHVYGSWVPGAILLAFPAEIGIMIIFIMIILTLFIPKLDVISRKLYELLQIFSEREVVFHETEEWGPYYWFCGITIVLYLSGLVMQENKRIRKALGEVKKEVSDLFRILSRS